MQRLADDVGEVGVVEASANIQLVGRLPVRCQANANQQSVDRVVGEIITMNVRPDAIERIIKAIWVGRDRSVRAESDSGKGDRRTFIDDMNRRKHRRGSAAAVTQICLINAVQEEVTPVLVTGIAIVHVRIATEDDSTPVTWSWEPPRAVGIAADRIVMIRGQIHRVVGCACLLGSTQNL